MSTHTRSWAASKRYQKGFRWFLLGLAIIVFLLPILWTFLASWGVFPDDTSSPPTWTWPPTFENYIQIGVAEPGFLPETAASISVAVTATVLTIAVAFLAAYGMARSRLRNSKTGIQAFLILASLPVMAYIIPLSNTVHNLRLYDTFVGVALADTAIFTPLAVYILFGYVRQVPLDLEEAARLDGATFLKIIWRVVVPMASSGIAATAIILFVLNWNLLLVPLALTENHVKTIPVAMSDFFTFERDMEWPVAAAVLVTSLLPLVALVAVAHRTLEQFRLRSV